MYFIYKKKGKCCCLNFRHQHLETPHKKTQNTWICRTTNCTLTESHSPFIIWTINSILKSTMRRKEMFYLTMHSTHFIYGYMASDIWLRTTLIVRKETRCRHRGYSFRLAARVLLYTPSHGLCYTSRGALAGMRNSSMGPPHEGSIRRPIAPWANALTTELHLAPQ